MAFLRPKELVVIVLSTLLLPVLLATETDVLDESEFTNLDEIVEKVNDAGTSWKAHNYFGRNTTGDHLRHLVSKFRPSNGLPEEKVKLCSIENLGGMRLNGSFDARKNWPQCPSMSHIWNQGACQNGWAVVAAGVISDRQCVASNGTSKYLMSAQHLTSCCSFCGHGCNGGFPRKAFQFYQKHGVVTGGDYSSDEGCQPYELKPAENFNFFMTALDTPVCQKKCTNKKYGKIFRRDRHFGKGVFTPCCCTIGDTLQDDGPVGTSMIVYEDFFAYKSGIYRHIWGKRVGFHSVRLLGWDVEDGIDYWIAANSWGKNWGENGFFKILRGKGECDFDFGFVAPKMRKYK